MNTRTRRLIAVGIGAALLLTPAVAVAADANIPCTVSRAWCRDQRIAALEERVADLEAAVYAAPTTGPTPEPTPTPTPTPDPTPSTTPSPSQTPSPEPSAGTFPDASTTGVPAGTVLTAYTGPSRITQAGTVIDHKLITTPLVIAGPASNVTIRNSRIQAEGYWLVLNDEGATNLEIVDSELDGQGHSANDAAVAGRNYTLTRVNIHGTIDGLKLGDNVTVQDSWIHDLVVTSASHNDGMQSLGADNVLIRHNTVVIAGNATSAILLSTGSGAQRNIRIEDNLVGGGAFTIYGGYDRNVDQLSRVSNIAITGNHITTVVYPRGGYYGPLTSIDPPVVTEGNVWQDGPRAGQSVS